MSAFREGGTVARQQTFGDVWAAALADCAFSRGKLHWGIQVLRYSDTEHVSSTLEDRMAVQEMAIKGLSVLSASGVSAAKKAGVWGQVQAAVDQATTLHGEVISALDIHILDDWFR